MPIFFIFLLPTSHFILSTSYFLLPTFYLLLTTNFSNRLWRTASPYSGYAC